MRLTKVTFWLFEWPTQWEVKSGKSYYIVDFEKLLSRGYESI